MEQTLKKILPSVLLGLLSLMTLKYLLPLFLPILLGVSLSIALSPMIRLLQAHGNIRYNTAATISVSGILLLLGLLLLLLSRIVMLELTHLYEKLPEILSALSIQGERFILWTDHVSQQLPAGIGDALNNWAEEIMSSGGTITGGLYEKLFSLVSGFLTKLPDHLLFFFTLILSCYFAAAELPRFSAILRNRLPDKYYRKLTALRESLKTVLGNWIRAQLKLMGVTFLILFAGFLLMETQLPILLALGISLLDALPLFGTGTVLLPWGLFSVITGNFHLGVGLIILYGIAALCRNVLEPKFLGAQMGVSPLLTLLAIYVGYRISGFMGMLLLPIFLMLGSEVLEARQQTVQTFCPYAKTPPAAQ